MQSVIAIRRRHIDLKKRLMRILVSLYTLKNCLTLLVLSAIVVSCNDDPRLASTLNAQRKPLYAFFNDVRLDIEAALPNHPRLPEFMDKTKNFLESQESQDLYKLSGMYFEYNLNREEGAYEYEDRFFDNGCIVHIILYPADQQILWQNLQGYNKGGGMQVGRNFLFHQVFSAQPTDEVFEQTIVEIINNNVEKHAAALGAI